MDRSAGLIERLAWLFVVYLPGIGALFALWSEVCETGVSLWRMLSV